MEVTLKEFMRHHNALQNRQMWARAQKIFQDFGPLASWKIDKLFENAIDQNRVDRVVNALEEAWETFLVNIPDEVRRQIEIRLLIDHIYAEHFELRAGMRVVYI